jgi:hypothetical protein
MEVLKFLIINQILATKLLLRYQYLQTYLKVIWIQLIIIFYFRNNLNLSF